MSARERLLAIILLGLIFVAVGGFVGYLVFVGPIQSKNRQARSLENEMTKLEEDVDALRQDARRFPLVKARSLPADATLAREEYKEALAILLRDAHAPAGFTIIPRSADTRGVPNLAPKKPAYNRLVFDINLDKVDLPMLTTFLENFHRLNLAHRITGFTIKRNDDTRGAGTNRKDLKVTLTAESIIMDGAEKRRTLLSIPPVLATIGGGLGYQAIAQTAEAGRGLIGQGEPVVLSPADRKYAHLAVRDFFHGPLPPPKPPEPPAVAEAPPPPPKPKEDVSPYIRLVGLTVRSNGTSLADVWDTFNNVKYEVEAGIDGTRVQKYVRSTDGARTPDPEYRSGGVIRLNPPDSSTNRSLRLIAVKGDGLYLAEAATGSRSESRVPTEAMAAVVGGVIPWTETPTLYFWKVGRSLKELVPLPATETQEILRQAEQAVEAERRLGVELN
ncbi:MAG: hypothetical protein LC104_04155 [Bacteroidales bacterium]|nr:hypothetical protein [Bacteroidales bacterium]